MIGIIMKKNFIYLSLFSLLISLFLLSCETAGERDRTEKGSLSATTNINTIWNGTKNYTFREKKQFKTDVDAAKEKLNNKIDELQKIAGTMWGNSKANYNNAVEKLKEEKEILNKRMSNFNDATNENWNDFKSGVNSILNDIERTLESITGNS